MGVWACGQGSTPGALESWAGAPREAERTREDANHEPREAAANSILVAQGIGTAIPPGKRHPCTRRAGSQCGWKRRSWLSP